MTLDSIQDKETTAVVQRLLNGTYNGSQPEFTSLGRWEEDVKMLWQVHSNTHDVGEVRQTFADRTKINPDLGALIASAPFDSERPSYNPPIVPELPEIARLAPGLEANASPWLDAIVAFLRKWSPRAYEGFYKACALWLLSVIAARRVVLHHGGARYPSLYVALVATTSIWSKSTTMKIAIQILQELELEWMLGPDDATPQAFINSLSSKIPPNYDDLPKLRQQKTENKLALRGARGWFYEEFGGMFHAMHRQGGTMSDYRSHIRRLDDCPSRYEYLTFQRGSDIVENAYLALCGNCTPADLKTLARRDSAMWTDGFLARFVFVSPGKDVEPKTTRFPEGERIIPAGILSPLKKWHVRLGLPTVEITATLNEEGKKIGKKTIEIGPYTPVMCTFGEDVIDAFYRYDEALVKIVHESDLPDLNGNYTRFSEKALRVAMLLASLENDNKIELRHWALAQKISEEWRADLHALYEIMIEADLTEKEQMEERVIRFVRRKGKVTARNIYQGIRGLNTVNAKKILTDLVNNDILIVEVTKKKTLYLIAPEEKV